MNNNKPDSPYLNETARGVYRGRRGQKRPALQGEKKRRWLFLLVDILLLVFVVAMVFFLVVLLTPLDLFGGSDVEEREITYTVELAGVDRDQIASLHTGDTVTDAETGSVIGEVIKVDSRPYEVYTETPEQQENGLFVVTKNTYPDTFNTVTVTIQVTADYEAGLGYTAEDCRIAAGRSYRLRFPAYAGEGVCITLHWDEEVSQ